MGTSYSDIFDLFQVHIKDWRLDALYQESPTNWSLQLEAFLVLAVQDFTACDQSLTRNDTTQLFDEALSEKNQSVLAAMMVKYWLKREVHDIRQMELHVQDDFKTFSEAQNLQAKEGALDRVKEEISQLLVDYGYNKSSLWSEWLSGNFYTP